LLEAFAVSGDAEYGSAFVRHFSEWFRNREHAKGNVELDAIWNLLGVAIRARVLSDAYLLLAKRYALPATVHSELLSSILGSGRWLRQALAIFVGQNIPLSAATTLAELGTLWPEFDEAAAWRELGCQRLREQLLLSFYPDGGHVERSASYHAE